MDRFRLSWDLAEGHKPRSAERFVVSVPVTLRPEGFRMVQVSVGDISSAGFMAHCDDPIALGAHVDVDLPGVGSVPARVRWTVGARMGARFAEPIDVARCRAAILALASETAGG